MLPWFLVVMHELVTGLRSYWTVLEDYTAGTAIVVFLGVLAKKTKVDAQRAAVNRKPSTNRNDSKQPMRSRPRLWN